MTVYKRRGSSIWHCEFIYKGQRVRESTGTTDRAEADAYEQRRREEVCEQGQEAQHAQQLRIARTLVLDAARSWLKESAATRADYRNDLSRVRKLFGREMRLEGDHWCEFASSRAGLDRSTSISEVTPELVQRLALARVDEGNSPATIARERSLINALLTHAEKVGGITPLYEPEDGSLRLEVTRPDEAPKGLQEPPERPQERPKASPAPELVTLPPGVPMPRLSPEMMRGINALARKVGKHTDRVMLAQYSIDGRGNPQATLEARVSIDGVESWTTLASLVQLPSFTYSVGGWGVQRPRRRTRDGHEALRLLQVAAIHALPQADSRNQTHRG